MFEIAELKQEEDEEEEPVVERPHSYSVPNMAYNPDSDDYQFEITRDFRLEMQNYFTYKKRKELSKVKPITTANT